MSKFTDYFPASTSGGGSGGGGILKHQIFTTSGTFDLTSIGIADGALIQLFLVGGGSAGSSGTSSPTGGTGGKIWNYSTTIGTAGTVTVTIGAGGSSVFAPGGQTTITGGGITGTISTADTGAIPGGLGARADSFTQSGPKSIGGFNAGFSRGGPVTNSIAGGANTGDGGGATSSIGAGGSGIAIIFYS